MLLWLAGNDCLNLVAQNRCLFSQALGVSCTESVLSATDGLVSVYVSSMIKRSSLSFIIPSLYFFLKVPSSEMGSWKKMQLRIKKRPNSGFEYLRNVNS